MELAARHNVALGLATGNFREAALIKLRHFGLGEHLAEGGFGDDAQDRAEVVRLAIERVGNGARAPDAWVVGDTPLDVAAALANGVRALGVATGSTPAEELGEAGADVMVEDLSDLAGVIDALLG